MSKLLNSGKTDFKNMKEQRAAIIKKWEESGLLDGLTSFKGDKRKNIADLYQGKASCMLKEEIPVFPIVRRIFEKIGDKEICGIHTVTYIFPAIKYEIDEDRIMF